MLPPVLTIAGFDCSAGAGLQADLKTFTALGTHGVTAATCLVAETANEVTRIDPVAPEMVQEQISLILRSYPVAAVKIGMLYGSDQILAVVKQIRDLKLPIIIDPVMIASSGAPLLQTEALELFQQQVLPRATVITPNRAEAEFLLKKTISSLSEATSAAQELAVTYHCTCILKGGHFDDAETATDIISTETGEITSLSAPRLAVSSSHGTGCTFAAALTAEIAKNRSLNEAAQTAKDFVLQAMKQRLTWPSHQISALDQSGQNIIQS